MSVAAAFGPNPAIFDNERFSSEGGDMRKTTFNIVAAVIMSVLVLSLAGCGGGGAKLQSEINTTTTGQQLMDLKKALDAGAITQDEYDKQRKKILDK
jgi:uncharacterized membrane protein